MFDFVFETNFVQSVVLALLFYAMLLTDKKLRRHRLKLDNMVRAWNDVVALREQDKKELEGKINQLRRQCNNANIH